MKMVDHHTLRHLPTPGHVGEVSQQSKFRFSIAIKVGDKFQRLMPFIACRDFFNDFFIYGFGQRERQEVYDYRPWNSIPRTKKFYLLVSNRAKALEDVRTSVETVNMHYLDPEKMKEIEVIDVEQTDNKYYSQHDQDCLDSCVALDVPRYWFRNAYSVALLTHIIRYNDPDVDKDDEEVEYSFGNYLGIKSKDFVKYVPHLPKLYDEDDSFVGMSTDNDKYSLHDCGLVYYNRHIAKKDSDNIIVQYMYDLMRNN